jgi:hypothetical protein
MVNWQIASPSFHWFNFIPYCISFQKEFFELKYIWIKNKFFMALNFKYLSEKASLFRFYTNKPFPYTKSVLILPLPGGGLWNKGRNKMVSWLKVVLYLNRRVLMPTKMLEEHQKGLLHLSMFLDWHLSINKVCVSDWRHAIQLICTYQNDTLAEYH